MTPSDLELGGLLDDLGLESKLGQQDWIARVLLQVPGFTEHASALQLLESGKLP